MNLKAWGCCAALVLAGADVAVNLATELRNNVLAWAVAAALVVLGALLGVMTKQGEPGRAHQAQSTVLNMDERNGAARRTVSTTSEKVALKLIESIPPLSSD